jgi:predicted AAA+ superfamily ATPase
MIPRILNLSDSRSYFLFGPRQTGKSTLIKEKLTASDLYINLLPERTFFSYAKEPGRFRQEILAHAQKHPNALIVVDEIQKLPRLLDEVHDLIESTNLRFALTGSSARKLKRGAANMLAGRANTYHLFPLTYEELGTDFDLERALEVGTLPYLWSYNISKADEREFLESYSNTYLRDEIQSEGVVRQISAFTHFLDIAAVNDGQLVNFSNIARECGVSVKTAQEYYQILEDTFIAHRIEPWSKSIRKRLVSHPRYYFFDMGLTNALCLQFGKLNSEVRGRRFEQFILLQLIAWNKYHKKNLQFFFWRTHIGVEIDLIISRGDKPIAAIEIKSSNQISPDALNALKEFSTEYPKVKSYIVSPIDRSRLLDGNIEVIPWKDLFHRLSEL